MASGMKWAIAVAGLTAALGLVVARGGMPGRAAEYGAQSAVWRTNSELSATRRAILQWSTLDAVRALVPDSGVAFELAGASEGTHDVLAEMRDSIESELAGMGGSRARIAVLTRAAPERAGLQRPVMTVQYFAEADSLGSWCAIVVDPVVTHPFGLRQAIFAGGSALGPCAFWARYGAPGGALAQSLPDFGQFLGSPRPAPADSIADARGLFGARRWENRVAPYVVAQACVAGRLEACDRALNDSFSWTTPFFGVERTRDDAALLARGRYTRGVAANERLMADLRADIGDDAFARFWRAEGDVNDALGAATGTSSSEWMHRWAVARFGAQPRGPSLDPLTLLLTLVALGLLVAASLLVAERRRVA